jgi:hypothetical protein
MSQKLLKWCVLVKTTNHLKCFCDINKDSPQIIFGITMHMLFYYTILKIFYYILLHSSTCWCCTIGIGKVWNDSVIYVYSVEGIYPLYLSRKKNRELPTWKLVHVTKTHGCTSAREVLESMPHVMDTMQELRELSGKKVILFCFLIIVSYTAYFFLLWHTWPLRSFLEKQEGRKRARGRNATIAGLRLQDEDVGVAMPFLEFHHTFKEVVKNLCTIYMMSKKHHKYNNMCGGCI